MVPKALKDAGLVKNEHNTSETQCNKITDETLQLLIKNYCRESGVRSLEKSIERIARKIAFEQVGDDESDGEIIKGDHKEVVIRSQRRSMSVKQFLQRKLFMKVTILHYHLVLSWG